MKPLLAALLIVLSACAPLSRHNSELGDAGEIAGRVLLCPLTLCLSEAYFHDEWQKEEAQRRYWVWYDSLAPERQALEDQRKHERSLASMQALGMALSHQGPIFQPVQVKPIAPPAPAETVQPLRLNCSSYTSGNTVHTTCY